MDIQPIPLLIGIAMMAIGLRLPWTDVLTRMDNTVIRTWGSKRRVEPDSAYARFRAISSAVVLCFLGVLFVLAGLGVG